MAAEEIHHEVLFNALKALWTADSNKFGGGTISAGVRDFVREGDPRNNSYALPFVEVSIRDERTDSLDKQYVECVATLILNTRTDAAHSEQNAFASEINRLYHGVSLNSTGTDWKFGPGFVGSMRQLGQRLRENGKTNQYAIPIKAVGYKTASSGIRQLLGAEGKVTWTKGTGGEDIKESLIEVVGIRVSDTESIDFRLLGAQWAKPRGISSAGTLFFRQKVGAGAGYGAHIPNGVAASVVLYTDRNSTSIQKWTFSARVSRVDTTKQAGDAGGEPQTALYEAKIDGAITETQ